MLQNCDWSKVFNCGDIEQVWLNWKMCFFDILGTCIPKKTIISKKFQNGKCNYNRNQIVET